MRRMSSRLWNIRWCMTIALVATVFPVATAQRVFAMDKAGFLNALGTLPRTVIDFDDISPDTDISGQQISGVQFVQAGAPLIVVNADDTYTPPDGWGGTARNPSQNKLIATTLKNVLSPGGRELVPGPDPNQEDSLILIFAQPIQAFGFDHISQSADGFSFTSVRVIGIDGSVLYSADRIPISNTGPPDDALPAADFWGILFDSPLIARIEFIETDNNNIYPDCNIGYDTMIVVVPEPASCIALGAGLVGLMLRRRKVA